MNDKLFKRISVRTSLLTFVIGMLVHSFFLNNVLKNYDATIIKGYGSGVTSGRWLLDWAGGHFSEVWGDYNIPYFTGMIALFVFSLAVGFIVEILEIHNILTAILVGVILICFPSTTTTMLFTYTTLFDAIAVLLAVLSVYVTEKYKYGWCVATVLMACSLGIYQAYLPMMITLFLLLGMKKLYYEYEDRRIIYFSALKYIGAIVGSLAVYYLVLMWRLAHTGSKLSTYRGIDEMGSLDGNILAVIFNTYSDYFGYQFYKNTGIAKTLVSVSVFYIMQGVTIALLALLIYRAWKKSRVNGVLLLIASLVLPLAINSIDIMCSKTDVSTLMAYTMLFVLVIPLVFFEWLVDNEENKRNIISISRRITIGLLVVVSLNYAYQANGCYANMYYSNQQAVNYLNGVFTQVRSTEGFTSSKKWVLIGKDFNDPMYDNPWNVFEFQYGGSELMMMNGYFRDIYINQFLGMKVSYASEEEKQQLMKNPQVLNMPKYPDNGSIQVIDDYVIIKIAE